MKKNKKASKVLKNCRIGKRDADGVFNSINTIQKKHFFM